MGSPRRQPRVPSTSECRFNKSPHHRVASCECRFNKSPHHQAHQQSKGLAVAGGVSVSGRQPRPSTVHPSSPGGGYFPRHFCSLQLFLDSKLPLQAELLASKRALRLMLAPQPSGTLSVCCRHGCSAQASADRRCRRAQRAVARMSVQTLPQSWLLAIGTGGRWCGTGTAVGDVGRARVRMDSASADGHCVEVRKW